MEPVRGSLLEKMAYLDAALTGKSWKDVCHTQATQRKFDSPITWAYGSDVYYLSDGGYSRVGYSLESGRLFLTSNSLAKPREAWANCKELISDLESAIQAGLSEDETQNAVQTSL